MADHLTPQRRPQFTKGHIMEGLRLDGAAARRGSRFERLDTIMSPSQSAARAGERPARSQAGSSTVSLARLDPVAAARAQERQRIREVFASEHAKGRAAMAALLLVKTTMSGAAIAKMLATVRRDASVEAEARSELANWRSTRNRPTEKNHGWAHAYRRNKK